MHAMTGMPDVMQEAMDVAFGAALDTHLQPLVVKITDLEVQVSTLTVQVAAALELVDQIRNGKGMLARFLNGG